MIFQKTPRKKRPGWIAQRLRARLAEAQNWRCAYCHGCLEPDTVTIEHVVPLVLGGEDAWENMAAACQRCNQRRGTMAARYLNRSTLYESREARREAKRRRRKERRALFRNEEAYDACL